MYLKPTQTYYRGTEQCASRQWFLILCHPKTGGFPLKHHDCITETRAIVRKVAMSQCGHWMMGTARACGHSITLSGSYGADGLICDVPPEVYEKALPVPQELMELWKDGGGWNSAGSEGDAMRRWALANLGALRGKRETTPA